MGGFAALGACASPGRSPAAACSAGGEHCSIQARFEWNELRSQAPATPTAVNKTLSKRIAQSSLALPGVGFRGRPPRPRKQVIKPLERLFT